MLKQRVITALVLMAILLPAMFYPQAFPFCALALLAIAAASWEWGRLNGFGQRASLGLAALSLLVCGAVWWEGGLNYRGSGLWLLAGAAWVLLAAWLLRAGVPAWAGIARPLRLLGGLFALWVAWLAVAQARVQGINFLLSVLALVWAADIAAYFAGKAFGTRLVRRKLAPGISPGKSWEGVLGGVLGVFALSWAWRCADQAWSLQPVSFYSQLQGQGAAMAFLALLFMTAMSVVGDLVESLIKRSANVKDSSGLLPGHGGVLDRVDALLPTLPLAMMLQSLLR